MYAIKYSIYIGIVRVADDDYDVRNNSIGIDTIHIQHFGG